MIEIKSESDMLSFAEKYGQKLLTILNNSSESSDRSSSANQTGQVIELIGDVGAGKTTFIRGLAKGLGISDPITSPSFTISKVYALEGGRHLVHYDFYRLPDPGLMRDELTETLSDPQNLVVVEWADSVQDLLPPSRQTIKFSYTDSLDNSENLSPPESSARTLEFIPPLDSEPPETAA